MAEREASARKRSPMTIVAAIGTILTVVSAAIGLLFLLVPAIKPEPPSPTRSAKLTPDDFAPNLSMRQMLDRTHQSTAGLTRHELAARVVFLRYHFETVGYKGESLPVESALIRGNGDQVEEETPFSVEPEANQDSGTWFTWAPLPRDRARYRLVVRIYEPKRVVPIYELQSHSFRGGG